MFYRRKVILSLIQLLGGKVEKIRLQKLMFLLTQRQSDKAYDFVPYKYGCYSYSANADVSTMVRTRLLSEDNNDISILDVKDYTKTLKLKDQELLNDIALQYGKMSNNDLIKHAYLKYPFYAIKSEIAPRVLSEPQLQKIYRAKPNEQKKVLFTLGYEGISLESYLQKLIKNNVRLLVDVRKNPLSRKFGFSKKPLEGYCNSLDIKYAHLPKLGIASDKRQHLNTAMDRSRLFEYYNAHTLNQEIASQKELIELLTRFKRVALTCFEADYRKCHRSYLANNLSLFPAFDYEIVHL